MLPLNLGADEVFLRSVIAASSVTVFYQDFDVLVFAIANAISCIP